VDVEISFTVARWDVTVTENYVVLDDPEFDS
jgi:hypothetical protein